MVENRQTQKNLENRQSKYFCLTYFSKLNREHVEKKFWHFEDNPVSGGETLQKIPKKRHHLSLGFDILRRCVYRLHVRSRIKISPPQLFIILPKSLSSKISTISPKNIWSLFTAVFGQIVFFFFEKNKNKIEKIILLKNSSKK